MITFSKIRAVLLDMDGTLYDQRPLRSLMAFELMTLPLRLRSMSSAMTRLRILRHFRKIREDLRHLGQPTESMNTFLNQ